MTACKMTDGIPQEPNGNRYRRGYDTRHLDPSIQKWLKDAERSNLPEHLLEAVLTVGSIPAIALIFLTTANRILVDTESSLLSAFIIMLAYVFAAIAIARQQRGVELMVHDASHRVWCPSKPWLNDLLADVMVAYPVLSSIRSYWESHRVHHMQYGSHKDPCRQRFAAMGLADLDLSTKWKITCAVINWLPSYNTAYYKEIGSLSLSRWRAFALWHILIMIMPSSIAAKVQLNVSALKALFIALVAWTVFWVIPAISFLPVLRSLAESEEHDYSLGETEFETTFTNNSFFHRLLIHPKGDAFHLIHHLFPKITERRHKRVHEILMSSDPKYRAALHRKNLLNIK